MSQQQRKSTHHGGVPEEQPKKNKSGQDKESLRDATTGSEGGGPAVGYGGNPHDEEALTIPDLTQAKEQKCAESDTIE